MGPTYMVEVPQNEDKDKEIAVGGPGGVSLRAKGYRIVDLIMVCLAVGFAWGAWELKAHAGGAERQSAAIVKSINEANAAVVQSLKESNNATVKALQDLAAEQKRATLQITIGNCMNEAAMKHRPDAREACTRIIRRGDDR